MSTVPDDKKRAAYEITEILRAAGYESPDFILCIWHGADRLAVLCNGVPEGRIEDGLQQVINKLHGEY